MLLFDIESTLISPTQLVVGFSFCFCPLWAFCLIQHPKWMVFPQPNFSMIKLPSGWSGIRLSTLLFCAWFDPRKICLHSSGQKVDAIVNWFDEKKHRSDYTSAPGSYPVTEFSQFRSLWFHESGAQCWSDCICILSRNCQKAGGHTIGQKDPKLTLTAAEQNRHSDLVFPHTSTVFSTSYTSRICRTMSQNRRSRSWSRTKITRNYTKDLTSEWNLELLVS